MRDDAGQDAGPAGQYLRSESAPQAPVLSTSQFRVSFPVAIWRLDTERNPPAKGRTLHVQEDSGFPGLTAPGAHSQPTSCDRRRLF